MKTFILLFVILLTTACTTPLTSSGVGYLVTSTTEGQIANNDVAIEKKGKSCQVSLFGLVTIGDSSVKSAKDNGQIKNIATIDRTYFGLLGLFGTSCLVVQGN